MKEIDLSRFNLYTVLRDLGKNLWVILLALITGLVGGLTYHNHIRTERFVSEMIVSVNLSGQSSSSASVAINQTVSIAEILDDVFQSSALHDVVKKDIGESMTGEISAAQLGKTNIIKISVSDISPEKAHDTLVSVYNNYDKVTDYVFNNVIIRTLTNPTMPTHSDGSFSAETFGILCALLCAFLVTAVIVVISFMRDTVKNVSDVEKELNAKLFGTVYSIKGMKKSLPLKERLPILTNPRVGYEFVNSFRKMAVKIESLKRTKGYGSFLITGVAENEGKTTVAVNLALSLAQDGKKVLLADCDFRHPSAFRFFDGIERDKSLDFHAYLTEGGDVGRFIKHDTATGVYVLDNVSAYGDSAELLGGGLFKSTMKLLKENFDFVIVDTPPCGIIVDAEIVSESVDAALLTVRQDVALITEINEQIANLDKCSLAGCIFNDVSVVKMPKVLRREGQREEETV